jgi:hypothetical protein
LVPCGEVPLADAFGLDVVYFGIRTTDIADSRVVPGVFIALAGVAILEPGDA